MSRNRIRSVFMGTPEFAVPSLRALAQVSDVSAVLTRPDAVSGRGGHLRPTPVKTAALELGLDVHSPSTLRDQAATRLVGDCDPDVVVVAAYGLILPQEVLDIPRLGCVNVHASLLPRWRGAAPVQRAILAGDQTTGVTIMKMEAGLDTGPTCLAIEQPIGDMDTPALTHALAELGATALLRALTHLTEGSCVWVTQDHTAATYADKIAKSDVSLAPAESAEIALRKVRASSPQAPARACVDGRTCTVLAAHLGAGGLLSGAVRCTKGTLELGFSDGSLVLDAVKPEGRGGMVGAEWARGCRFEADACWTAVT